MNAISFIAWMMLLLASCRGDGLVVNARVYRSGFLKERFSGDSFGGRPGCQISLELKNPSSEPVYLAFMSCSWSSSLEIFPADSFSISDWECSANMPMSISIESGSHVTFDFPIVVSKGTKYSGGQKVRFGFILRKLRARDDSQFKNGVFFEDDQRVAWSGMIEIPSSGNDLVVPWGEKRL